MHLNFYEPFAPNPWTWGAKIEQLISTKIIEALIWTFFEHKVFYPVSL